MSVSATAVSQHTTVEMRTKAPGTLSRIGSLARGEFITLAKTLQTVLVWVVFSIGIPLISVFIFGGDIPKFAWGYSLASALVMPCASNALYYTASSLVKNRQSGALQRYTLGELGKCPVFVAQASPGVLLSIVTAVVAVAVLLRVSGIPLPQHMWLIAIYFVGTIALALGLALVSAAYSRTVESVQYAALPAFMLLVVGDMVLNFPPALWEVVPPLATMIVPGVGSNLLIGQAYADTIDPVIVVGGVVSLALWSTVLILWGAKKLQWNPRS